MKVPNQDKAAHARHALAELTGAFLQAVAAPTPTPALATVHCLSRSTATTLITRLRDQLADPVLRHQSARSLLALLETSQVLQRLPLDQVAQPSFALYALGAQPLSRLDPIELLLATEPGGVVCYFTALAYHGLTTQSPPHHHIAKPTPTRNTHAVPRVRPERGVSAAHDHDGDDGSAQAATQTLHETRAPGSRQRSAQGSLRFRYQSIPYYCTHRGVHTLAGVQNRQLNEFTIARITTYEQTLLDTLHRPVSCGGLSVVWEAWRKGLSRLDEERLLAYLMTLDDPRHLLRVGYLLETLRHEPLPALRVALDRARDAARADPAHPVVPLFPGLPALSVDPQWAVAVPFG